MIPFKNELINKGFALIDLAFKRQTGDSYQ